MQKAFLMVALFATAALAGCASGGDDADDEPVFTEPTYTPGKTTNVTERIALPFNVTAPWSQTLEAGAYDILPGASVYVDIELPVTEGGSALLPNENPQVHLGLFLPAIPGCDWDASDLGEECNVPVIADAGPYYTESDVDAEDRGSGRLGECLISNFVPHGYAVAQISVFGSGKSNHCFDMFGLAEQLGVHGAVEWLGNQPWSNGNVGLIGRSYDGSTPWMAAAHAFEGSALKTIVPISGLTGLQDLVTWNGASETRVALFQNVIYAQFGLNPDDPASLAMELTRRATCPDWTTSTAWGGLGYVEGNGVVDIEGSYWEERNFGDRVVQNYRGSVYLIHGLQDDNVDPHAGWQLHRILEDGGWETKGLYGQWYHSYPDRPGEHGGVNQEPRNSVRYDWAQDLLEWFDHYLKGSAEKPALIVEVQEHSGAWRIDDKLQPANSRIEELPLGSGDTQVTPAGGGTFVLGPFEEDLVMGGFSTLKLSVTPLGPGGQIFANLINMDTGADFGLSYGVMELRQATGQTAPVVPGQPMDIEIPIQYFSDVLPAGERLGVSLSGMGNNYLPSPVVTPVTVHLDDSSLMLSIIEPEAGDYFQPPEWMADEA